jgi:hypothetical protein
VAELGIPYQLITPRGTTTFNGFENDPVSGFAGDYYRLMEVLGLDGAALRTPTRPRPQADGEDISDFFRAARHPAFRGRIIAPTGLWQRTVMEDLLRDRFHSILRADGTLRWEPRGRESNAATPLTVSGNEITDAVRAANVSGDGRAADSSFGIWEATTNLATNGGFETNTTGWTDTTDWSLVRDTTRAKFGAASLKMTHDTAGTDSNMGHTPANAPAAGPLTASAWIWIPADWDGGTISMSIEGHVGSSTVVTVAADMSKRDQWQRIYHTINVVSGDLIGAAVLRSGTVPTTGRFIYVDGVQVEAQPFPTPYVHTDGATATRNNARVQMPASLLDETRGWVAFRIRSGWSNASEPYGGSGFPYLFRWGDSANDEIQVYYEESTNRFVVGRDQGGAGQYALVTKTLAVDEVLTVVAAWDAAGVKLSINGAVFAVTGGTPRIPVLAATLAEIGSFAGTSLHFDADVLWMATGTGALTDADAATIHGFGNATSSTLSLNSFMAGLSEAARPTMLWNAETAEYAIRQWRRLTVRAFEQLIMGGAGPHRDFGFGLIAPDPTMYSDEEYLLSASASPWQVSVTNRGDADHYPVVRVHGSATPVTQVDVRNATTVMGIRLVGISIGAGQYVELDMARRRIVRSDGTNYIGKVDYSVGAFFTPTIPGANVWELANITGTPSKIEVFHRDAWA